MEKEKAKERVSRRERASRRERDGKEKERKVLVERKVKEKGKGKEIFPNPLESFTPRDSLKKRGLVDGLRWLVQKGEQERSLSTDIWLEPLQESSPVQPKLDDTHAKEIAVILKNPEVVDPEHSRLWLKIEWHEKQCRSKIYWHPDVTRVETDHRGMNYWCIFAR